MYTFSKRTYTVICIDAYNLFWNVPFPKRWDWLKHSGQADRELHNKGNILKMFIVESEYRYAGGYYTILWTFL